MLNVYTDIKVQLIFTDYIKTYQESNETIKSKNLYWTVS